MAGHNQLVNSGFWTDAKVINLEPLQKLAFLSILTGPNITSLGMMRGTFEGLASEQRVDISNYERLVEVRMVEVDRQASLMALPKYFEYHPLYSKNIVISWKTILKSLPECPLRTLMLCRAFEHYGTQEWNGFVEVFEAEGLMEALRLGLREGLPEGHALAHADFSFLLSRFSSYSPLTPPYKGGGHTKKKGSRIGKRTIGSLRKLIDNLTCNTPGQIELIADGQDGTTHTLHATDEIYHAITNKREPLENEIGRLLGCRVVLDIQSLKQGGSNEKSE